MNKKIRFQKPHLIKREKRLLLTRIRWKCGKVRGGKKYSIKLSISLCWKFQDMWIGIFWRKQQHEILTWICLLPCLPIGLHLMWMVVK
jgi:hypothetical protein